MKNQRTPQTMKKTNKTLAPRANNMLAVSTTNLTEQEIEKQEHLTGLKLKMLVPAKQHISFEDIEQRPKANLIDLMGWARSKFSKCLKNSNEVLCFIHNKIVIDGSFLKFCEESDAKIESLLLDSIASWKSEHNFEHFLVQGVFKISWNDVEFIHCALFHKGNQNEDEVSFFVLVEQSKYENYISFRNMFDAWSNKRDREQLQIHVVGAEGYEYTRDASWDDLFLPEDLKGDIVQSVEGFLSGKQVYETMRVPWKKGILLYGHPGCGKSSLIRTIISNYNFKPVTVQSGTQTNDETITEAFRYAQEQEPALLYIEDIDTLLDRTISLSHFLQMMDGVSTNRGILVIATANDLSKLKESITDRPSRFDRKWRIPLPNKDMAFKYLDKWFNGSISKKDLSKVVVSCVENNFSYAYLKELYLTSVFNALADKRELPKMDDISKAVEQLRVDKENARQGFDDAENSEALI